MTEYGEIFYVWFDGACGEGPNGKTQVYDFDGYIDLIHKLQPNATFFNDHGEIRWCGNEGGHTRYAEWAVVPGELCYYNKNVQTTCTVLDGDISDIYNYDIDIGSLSNIIYSKGLVFSPAEVDMSIRPGWFYHSDEQPHSLDRLFDTYLRSVGGNTTFNLNVPPMPNGMLDVRDVSRLNELGEKIRNSFSNNLAADAEITEKQLSGNRAEYIIKMSDVRNIHFIELCENIAEGQRVESFKVYKHNSDGLWEHLTMETTIGSRRILPVNIDTDAIKVLVSSARDAVEMESIKLY